MPRPPKYEPRLEDPPEWSEQVFAGTVVRAQLVTAVARAVDWDRQRRHERAVAYFDEEEVEPPSTSDHPPDVLEALRAMRLLRELIDHAIARTAIDARNRAGRSWLEIGRAVGMSKQAAHKKFSAVARTMREL